MTPIVKSKADLESHPLAEHEGFEAMLPFLIGISDFVARHLPSEDCITRKSAAEGQAKVIADDVVGYVRLKSWECALLDTALFQRLRTISQLAFIEQIYPTLGYRRFEHTIGVLGRTSQMISALLENAKFDSENELVPIERLISDNEPALRLAALFHDVGHSIYSHASESFTSNLQGSPDSYPSAQAISEFFQKAFKRASPPPIAEIISVAILCAPETLHFITHTGSSKRDIIQKRIQDASYFIFGSPPPSNGRLLFLAQIISSGLDADKLDYMTRESHYSRIPLGIDIPWLLSKLRVFKCDSKTLPRAYSSLKGSYAQDAEFLALGLVSSAQIEFEEFCFARVSLYDKIYLHQKNRALVAQAQREFKRFVSRNPKYERLHHWLDLRESDVSPASPSVAAGETLFAGMASNIQLTVSDRECQYHRAYAFGPRNSLTDPVGGRDSLETLPSVKLLEKIRGKEFEVAEKIEAEVAAILRLVNLKKGLKTSEIEVAVEASSHLNIQQGHDSLYFQRFRKPASRWILPVDMIIDYYRRNRACGYVFAPAEACPIVAVAAEAVFWREHKQQFSQDDGVPRHLAARSDEIREKLSKTRYYEQMRALRPASKYLASAAATELTHRVAEHLAGFLSYKQERITPQRAEGFISQFPEELQEPALRMCTLIKLIEPAQIANLVVTEYLRLRSSIWNSKRIALVPLGSIIESGDLLSYNFKNHSNPEFLKSQPRVEQLSDNVVNEVEAIIFYDDNINSGSQLINIFAARLGVDLASSRKLRETHGSPLSDSAKKRMRELPMHFVYGVAPENVLGRIQKEFEEAFTIDRDNLSLKAQHWLRDSEKTLSGPGSPFQHEKREDLRKFLHTVGTGLMMSEPGKTLEIAQNRALGDENVEALVIFPYNVPTMTILPLWCEGTISGGDLNGINWLPLAERRRSRIADGTLVGDDA
jgi:HD superfamily phosphohydrolase